MKQVRIILTETERSKDNAQKMLSNASRLATLLVNVSGFWIEARYDADIAKSEYENKFDSAFLELKKKEKVSDETAKAMARIECREIYVKWLELDRLSRKLYNMREDMDRQVSVWQSLASELRSQLVYRKGGDPIK